MKLRILIGEYSPRGLSPHHKRVHRSLHVGCSFVTGTPAIFERNLIIPVSKQFQSNPRFFSFLGKRSMQKDRSSRNRCVPERNGGGMLKTGLKITPSLPTGRTSRNGRALVSLSFLEDDFIKPICPARDRGSTEVTDVTLPLPPPLSSTNPSRAVFFLRD